MSMALDGGTGVLGENLSQLKQYRTTGNSTERQEKKVGGGIVRLR